MFRYFMSICFCLLNMKKRSSCKVTRNIFFIHLQYNIRLLIDKEPHFSIFNEFKVMKNSIITFSILLSAMLLNSCMSLKVSEKTVKNSNVTSKSYSTSSKYSSRFANAPIELGMSKDTFIKNFGKPFTADKSMENGKILDTLYYNEMLYAGMWYNVTTAFIFEDNKLIKQTVEKEERSYNSCSCDKSKSK